MCWRRIKAKKQTKHKTNYIIKLENKYGIKILFNENENKYYAMYQGGKIITASSNIYEIGQILELYYS